MRGRHTDILTMHKRVSSKEHLNFLEKDENLEHSHNGVWKDIGNPSWKRPLPYVVVATLSSFLFGYHLGVVNDTLESISLDLGFSGSTLAEGLVVSTCLGGAFLGSMFSGLIADGLGRRRSFQLCALPMIIGSSIRALGVLSIGPTCQATQGTSMASTCTDAMFETLEKMILAQEEKDRVTQTKLQSLDGQINALTAADQGLTNAKSNNKKAEDYCGSEASKVSSSQTFSATTSSLGGMLLGRFLVGTGMGVGPPVVAMYVSEVSPAFVRGTYGSFTQIATCLGLMTAFFIGIPAKSVLGWWRVCFWISAIPAVLLAFLMEFSAESPHWLLKRGKIADTEEELERLFGASHVKPAMAELCKSGRGDDMDTIKISELIHGRHFKVVFLGSVLFALQQLSGINAVFYFSSTVFRSAGVSSDIGNICVGVVNLSGSIVAMILMDRLGRKVLLIWSFLGMALAMGFQVIAASGFLQGSGNMYLSVAGMLLFVATFSLGAGPVPGLLLSEIFPGRIRATAMAICMAVHWVINFFVGLLFLHLLEILGPKTLYTMFATVCLMAVAFVKKNVVETKGKSLQEIEMALLPVD